MNKIKKAIDQDFLNFKNNIKQKISEKFSYSFIETLLSIKKIWIVLLITILYFFNITFIVFLVNFFITLPWFIITMFFIVTKFALQLLAFFDLIYLEIFFLSIVGGIFKFIFNVLSLPNDILVYYLHYAKTFANFIKWDFASEINKHYFIPELFNAPGTELNPGTKYIRPGFPIDQNTGYVVNASSYKRRVLGDIEVSRWADIYVSFFNVIGTYFKFYITKVVSVLNLLFLYFFASVIYVFFLIHSMFVVIFLSFGIDIPGLIIGAFKNIFYSIIKFLIYMETEGYANINYCFGITVNFFEFIWKTIKTFIYNIWFEITSIRSFADIINLFYKIFQIEWKNNFKKVLNYTFNDFVKFLKSLRNY